MIISIKTSFIFIGLCSTLIGFSQNKQEQTNLKTADITQEQSLELVPINRENGFFEVLSYQENAPYDLFSYELEKHPCILFNELDEVVTSKDNLGRSLLTFVFSEQGAQQFKKITEKNINRPIALVINKKIYVAPFISQVITDGRMTLAGLASETATQQLLNTLCNE